MQYPNRFIEDLYNQERIDDYLESLRAKGLRYRTKIIISGDMLEVEIYPINPVWKDNKGADRERTVNPTRKAQRDLNNKNTRKQISRLIHANFSNKDIWLTFTYSPENMPSDEKEAQKDIQNYIRRLKRYISKNGLPDLKYIYVTERVINEDTGKVHAHHHIIMNFWDRDKAESLWTEGGRTQSRRLQPDDMGLEGLARYISKPETKEGNRKGAKTYAYSLNLKKPEVKRSDYRMPRTNYKLSKKRVSEMALNENRAIEVLEDNYSGYKLMPPMSVKFSDYTAGAYISARLINKTPKGA